MARARSTSAPTGGRLAAEGRSARSPSGLRRSSLQIIAWARLGFGPTDGGYASVYLGWTGLYTLFVFGSLYWLETCLALSFRYRAQPFARPKSSRATPRAIRTATRQTSRTPST